MTALRLGGAPRRMASPFAAPAHAQPRPDREPAGPAAIRAPRQLDKIFPLGAAWLAGQPEREDPSRASARASPSTSSSARRASAAATPSPPRPSRCASRASRSGPFALTRKSLRQGADGVGEAFLVGLAHRRASGTAGLGAWCSGRRTASSGSSGRSDAAYGARPLPASGERGFRGPPLLRRDRRPLVDGREEPVRARPHVDPPLVEGRERRAVADGDDRGVGQPLLEHAGRSPPRSARRAPRWPRRGRASRASRGAPGRPRGAAARRATGSAPSSPPRRAGRRGAAGGPPAGPRGSPRRRRRPRRRDRARRRCSVPIGM